jgi:hypothetical protein
MQWSATVKICDDIRAMDHRTGFGYAPWAIAQDFVHRFESQRRSLLCAMGRSGKIFVMHYGHSAGFGYALWASTKLITMAQIRANFFKSL